jgi:hypothetical protein
MPCAEWSRSLPYAIVIPDVMTLATLTDVRELMRHLPAQHRGRSTWRYVAAELAKAAAGSDIADVLIALRLVLSIEGVEYVKSETASSRYARPPIPDAESSRSLSRPLVMPEVMTSTTLDDVGDFMCHLPAEHRA